MFFLIVFFVLFKWSLHDLAQLELNPVWALGGLRLNSRQLKDQKQESPGEPNKSLWSMCRAGDRGQGEDGGSGDQGVEDPPRHKPSIPPVVFDSSDIQPEHLSYNIKGDISWHDFTFLVFLNSCRHTLMFKTKFVSLPRPFMKTRCVIGWKIMIIHPKF